ncbi:Long chain base biosynthesis protein 2b [Galdieria sulphuraria]|nr:Long chain base biosynthesis protein 2b [Galdieria sulphuraria]
MKNNSKSLYDRIPYIVALTTYFSYAMVICFGYLKDFIGKLFRRKKFRVPQGYARLLSDFEDFYTRRLYSRIRDCWSRPVCSAPGAYIDVMLRDVINYGEDLRINGKTKRCLNLGSYNYLGYADVPGGVDDQVLKALDFYGSLVAEFLNRPAALVMGMGFATNSQIIPSLVGPGCLILSDELNHASIVVGARASGAKIKVFRHNNPVDLEKQLRLAIAEGQPRTHRPWKKILIIVEGIYSMEGEICPLTEIIELKKKYKAYLFLDEAHSIGALGHSGRGVPEYWNIPHSEVDILMGTFTKSFGAVGGYIAGSRELIEHLRNSAPGCLYSSSMSAVCAQHILFALEQIMGKDKTDIGQQKIVRLRENAIMFRRRLIELGIQVYGDPGSPVIPIMLYPPAKIAAFSRECLARGLAVVVVGFPATPLLLSRARICLSAAHTSEDLEFALHVIEEVAELIQIKYNDKKMIEIQLEEEEEAIKASEERAVQNKITHSLIRNHETIIHGKKLLSSNHFGHDNETQDFNGIMHSGRDTQREERKTASFFQRKWNGMDIQWLPSMSSSSVDNNSHYRRMDSSATVET